MNTVKFMATPQYQKWMKELQVLKAIRKHIPEDDVIGKIICDEEIAELKRKMYI